MPNRNEKFNDMGKSIESDPEKIHSSYLTKLIPTTTLEVFTL
jgi:hypothetical protein